MSRLGILYDRVYSKICGSHPNLRPWHFQWHFMRGTHKWQKKAMHRFDGCILDVGCGNKPYANWPKGVVKKYIGLDVYDGDGIDIVVKAGEKWPLDNDSIDNVVFAQVLEHVKEPEHVINEIKRVLKPGGHLLLTVPFLMPAHGLPYDYKRYTVQGIQALFDEGFIGHQIVSKGATGSVIATVLLSSIESLLNSNKFMRIIKGFMLPLWLLLTTFINLICFIIDCFGSNGTHYCNTVMLAKRSEKQNK